MNLRLLSGIDLKAFENRFGVKIFDVYDDQIRELKDIGLVEATTDNLRLTDKGLFLGNEVFIRFV